jgi:hypothetical protein
LIELEMEKVRPFRPIIYRVIKKVWLGKYRGAGRLKTGGYQLEISPAKEIAKVNCEGHPKIL